MFDKPVRHRDATYWRERHRWVKEENRRLQHKIEHMRQILEREGWKEVAEDYWIKRRSGA